jgi:MFS family permease
VENNNNSYLSRLREIPSAVWALGFVSLLMDTSSEIIHALLPVYLVTVLGASMVTVGLIEGIAEATASITKVFSGALSDWLGKRKLLAVIGYGLAAFCKPVFPLAPSVSWLVAARFIDRIGKGIRGAPRDAPGRGHRAGTFARCKLRTAPIARYGRGLCRPRPCHRPDVVDGE